MPGNSAPPRLDGAFAAGALRGTAPARHRGGPDGCSVLFEGYIANGAALRAALDRPGEISDAHLAAAAFRRWGPGMVRHVFGEWAAAIADEAAGTLLLASDALGLVALYYAEDAGEVRFSTVLRALDAGRGLDDTALLEFLGGLDDPGERSPLRGVRRVRQGHAVLLDPRLRSIRVHDPAAVPPLRLRDPMEYEQRFRAVTTEAVRTSLPRAGRTWCELSGGLDSSTVVSLAAGVLREPVAALSYVFSRSSDAEETGWMETVVAAFDLPWHRLDADRTPAFSSPPGPTLTGPSGCALTADFLRARSDLLVAHGVGTVLTGMCGDAVLVGDEPEPFYLADLRNPLRLWTELGRWARDGAADRAATFWLRRYVVRPLFEPRQFRPTRPPPPWIAAPHRQTCSAALAARRPPAGLPLGDAYYWDRVLQGALVAREGQQIGPTEFRNPLLFLPLVEFMAAVPWPVKLQPGSDRALQRRALRGILPERTRTRRDKRGPTQAIFAGFAASAAWGRLLSERPAIVERGYVDGDAWRAAVRLAQQGFCVSSRDFLRACMLEAWLSA